MPIQIMTKDWIKEIDDWEREYDAMDVPRTKREQEILRGDPIKSNEGMLYGRMYANWKRLKGYD